MRLLLVEDEPALACRVQESLQATGYTADWTRDGGVALTLARESIADTQVPAGTEVVLLVEYESDGVRLGTWPDAVVAIVDKAEILRRGREGDLFPPKTTRHTVSVPLEERPTALEDLR